MGCFLIHSRGENRLTDVLSVIVHHCIGWLYQYLLLVSPIERIHFDVFELLVEELGVCSGLRNAPLPSSHFRSQVRPNICVFCSESIKRIISNFRIIHSNGF